ncbi:lysylphosphatidylglycerol synthase transmembrane domain-containing protein [Bifidobacterium olomucense]|uniref:Lysylphosphatidylglycerol synthase TM region n=1 Tax=Bifidobacterium olomucense TaxID=2675324 RepID=A0A7Y0EW06_9BIFI|nr:lysylphosphatidylglycerol synthase transmembrane domain-containing protein [Bifidobacterium sp. DSM 109959]NMM97447.1 Lysylphosphatidylglycerol synthase TM region [Bifidobacterium sp. DSM 109959]
MNAATPSSNTERTASDGPFIEDVPPRRTHDFADLTRAALSLLMAAVVMVFAVYLGGMTRGVEDDAHTAAQAINWLADFPSTVLTQLATIVIVVIVLGQLLLTRAWLEAAVSALSMFAGYGAVWAISVLISGLHDATLSMALVSAATTFGSTLLPDIYAGMAAFLTAAGPRRIRSSVKWSWNILYATAAVMVVLSWHSVTGMLVSMAAGRTVGMLIRFLIGTQNTGVWGNELINALKGIGLDPVSLIRHQDAPLAGHGSLAATLDDDLAEGSRIYDLETAGGRRFIVSVLDAQSHSVGYLKQLWDWVRFTSVSIRRDRSVRESVQHHFAMLLGLNAIKLPAPSPYGMADTDESAILVLDAHTIGLPANLRTLTKADAVAYMRYLSVANRRGYTHRRITPNTLARLDDGTRVIAGWHNGDNASAPANMALDKVQLLALFAALIGVDDTIEAAHEAWGQTTLTTLVPFIQKVAVPSATRALGTWDKQLLADLRTRINAMTDEELAENTEPVTLARFSWRSMLTMLLIIVAVVVVFTQLNPEEIIAAIRNANPIMALVVMALGVCGWIGSSISLGALMNRNRRDTVGVFMSQVAGGFATVSMPAGVGPSFVNLQFLRKSGYRNTQATAIMSAALVVYYAVYFTMLVIIGLFTGRNTFTGSIPTNTLVIVLGIVVVVLSVTMMIPPARHWVTRRLMPLAKNYVNQLLDVLSHPQELTVSCLGALFQNITTGLAFWAALLAFGQAANPIEVTFVFMLAYALGSAVPTPGGLGGVEAALTFAFVAFGVPQGVALSATLLHRVVFYWLRIPLGAAAMKWLDNHNLV